MATTKAKATDRPKHKGARGTPVFMTKSQLAFAMGEVDTGTIDDWVAAGTVPPPHSRPGNQTSLWLRKHFESYVENGYWPPESFPPAPG